MCIHVLLMGYIQYGVLSTCGGLKGGGKETGPDAASPMQRQVLTVLLLTLLPQRIGVLLGKEYSVLRIEVLGTEVNTVKYSVA